MNTKSTTSWDDFFDNIFISDDEENRDEPEYTYADILAITYGAISGLIIFSNLWIILLIVCSKLRRHLYYLKIVVCFRVIFIIRSQHNDVSANAMKIRWVPVIYREILQNISPYFHAPSGFNHDTISNEKTVTNMKSPTEQTTIFR
jgi:hypothetical protein